MRSAALKLGVFDSLGDETTRVSGTRASAPLALVFHFPARVDVLAQYLDGTAQVRTPPNDSAVSAYYVLVSHHFKAATSERAV